MKSIAILHEGNAKKTYDNELITLLIEHLELNVQRIDFYGMGTKSNFFKEDYLAYKLLKQRVDSGQIKKILFILDADDIKSDATYGGFENTQAKLNTVITDLGLNGFSRIYIMCDPSTQTGYLESFILSTISTAQKRCIETFLNCSNFNSRENHKAILNQIYKLAYPNAPYDFEHTHFDLLKAELNNLFN